jgi:hypothetical protein
MKWIKNMSTRAKEVKMLHICLGDGWRIVDVIFVITGRIYG